MHVIPILIHEGEEKCDGGIGTPIRSPNLLAMLIGEF